LIEPTRGVRLRPMPAKPGRPPRASPSDERLRALRDELQRLTEGTLRSEHASAIEAIRGRFGHGIRLVEENDPNRDVRCVMYALGLAGTYAAELTIGKFPPAGIVEPRMLEFMIRRKRLHEIEVSPPRGGDLVVYFGDAGVKHAGLVHRGGVRSKWGDGHVWSHPTMQVPTDYGTSVRYFKRVSLPEALAAHEAYALTRTAKHTVDAALRPYRGPQS